MISRQRQTIRVYLVKNIAVRFPDSIFSFPRIIPGRFLLEDCGIFSHIFLSSRLPYPEWPFGRFQPGKAAPLRKLYAELMEPKAGYKRV